MQVVLSGNQIPKNVEITQEGIDAGAEVGARAGDGTALQDWGR
jgi:hypothetical protein